MYKKIRQHPTTLNIYGEKLIKEGTITAEEFNKNKKEFKNLLDGQLKTAKEYKPKLEWFEGVWSRYKPIRGQDKRGVTGVTVETIKRIGKRITHIPEDFNVHQTVRKIFDNKKKMFENGTGFDFATAEQLAFGTLLDEGTPVRLSGQDSGRGTFSQRHSVLRDQKDSRYYTPLNNISEKQKKFEVIDSVLSEFAVLGFEHGYTLSEPTTLVVWEAQFGDFANGAQVIIDQFITTGERKWGRLCGLTCMLPHGYEGQGPEHSSGRLERFKQLCADHNMQVVVPSTPAQVYAMLRRQTVRPLRRPLIVMTPKSLLRHPLAVSSLEELSEGVFHNVIDEIDDIKPENIERVIFCSGKVYYELLQERRAKELNNIAIVRMEQLYPFPHAEMEAIVQRYSHVKDFVWCQEEPQNQGAWYCSQHHFRQAIPANTYLEYAGRPASAAPACGSKSLHDIEQATLVADALTINK
jgi:2-oxoglutarate dehydrogenase E1 component